MLLLFTSILRSPYTNVPYTKVQLKEGPPHCLKIFLKIYSFLIFCVSVIGQKKFHDIDIRKKIHSVQIARGNRLGEMQELAKLGKVLALESLRVILIHYILVVQHHMAQVHSNGFRQHQELGKLHGMELMAESMDDGNVKQKQGAIIIKNSNVALY